MEVPAGERRVRGVVTSRVVGGRRATHDRNGQQSYEQERGARSAHLRSTRCERVSQDVYRYSRVRSSCSNVDLTDPVAVGVVERQSRSRHPPEDQIDGYLLAAQPRRRWRFGPGIIPRAEVGLHTARLTVAGGLRVRYYIPTTSWHGSRTAPFG